MGPRKAAVTISLNDLKREVGVEAEFTSHSTGLPRDRDRERLERDQRGQRDGRGGYGGMESGVNVEAVSDWRRTERPQGPVNDRGAPRRDMDGPFRSDKPPVGPDDTESNWRRATPTVGSSGGPSGLRGGDDFRGGDRGRDRDGPLPEPSVEDWGSIRNRPAREAPSSTSSSSWGGKGPEKEPSQPSWLQKRRGADAPAPASTTTPPTSETLPSAAKPAPTIQPSDVSATTKPAWGVQPKRSQAADTPSQEARKETPPKEETKREETEFPLKNKVDEQNSEASKQQKPAYVPPHARGGAPAPTSAAQDRPPPVASTGSKPQAEGTFRPTVLGGSTAARAPAGDNLLSTMEKIQGEKGITPTKNKPKGQDQSEKQVQDAKRREQQKLIEKEQKLRLIANPTTIKQLEDLLLRVLSTEEDAAVSEVSGILGDQHKASVVPLFIAAKSLLCGVLKLRSAGAAIPPTEEEKLVRTVEAKVKCYAPYLNILFQYTSGVDQAALRFLFETQRVAHGLGFPRLTPSWSLIEAVWNQLLVQGVISQAIFMKWREAPTEFELIGGWGALLFQTKPWFEWLDGSIQAVVDESSDQEEAEAGFSDDDEREGLDF